MPRTPPTIVAPLPDDPRVFALAKASGLATREAYACAAESWAWMADKAVDDIVVNVAPDSLDAVVEVEGFGQAMLQAGLVGTVDGGLVLPAELRRLAAGKGRTESSKERRRRLDSDRKKIKRRQNRLTQASSKTAAVTPTAEVTERKGMIRRLGDIDGFPVMLLWNRKGEPFYKLAGAQPDEVTATVTDPESPTLADALVALHAAMKRKASKGLGGPTNMRPTPEAVLAAAERYRAALEAAAANDARRDEANRAAAEAAADDQGDTVEADMSATCPHDSADMRTCPHECPQSGHEEVAASPYGRQDLDAESCPHECPQSGHNPAPSSSSVSSVSVSPEQSSKENTTTTSSVTDAERDNEDRILDRLAPRVDPEQAKQQERHRLWLERVAEALDTTTDAVKYQRTMNPDILLARMKAAGIDPKTGERVAAGASSKPSQARADIPATTEPAEANKPAGGSVDARAGDEAGKDFEAMKDRLPGQLRGVVIAAAADMGVKYA